MNTARTSITVGIVNVPGVDGSLIEHLQTLGVSVVTAENFRTAANLVKTAVEDGAVDLVVVGDQKAVGVRAWAESLSNKTALVPVASTGGAFEGSSSLEPISAPVTLWDVFASGNIQPPSGPSPSFADDGRLHADDDFSTDFSIVSAPTVGSETRTFSHPESSSDRSHSTEIPRTTTEEHPPSGHAAQADPDIWGETSTPGVGPAPGTRTEVEAPAVTEPAAMDGAGPDIWSDTPPPAAAEAKPLDDEPPTLSMPTVDEPHPQADSQPYEEDIPAPPETSPHEGHFPAPNLMETTPMGHPQPPHGAQMAHARNPGQHTEPSVAGSGPSQPHQQQWAPAGPAQQNHGSGPVQNYGSGPVQGYGNPPQPRGPAQQGQVQQAPQWARSGTPQAQAQSQWSNPWATQAGPGNGPVQNGGPGQYGGPPQQRGPGQPSGPAYASGPPHWAQQQGGPGQQGVPTQPTGGPRFQGGPVQQQTGPGQWTGQNAPTQQSGPGQWPTGGPGQWSAPQQSGPGWSSGGPGQWSGQNVPPQQAGQTPQQSGPGYQPGPGQQGAPIQQDVAEPAGFDFDQIRFGTDRALGKSDGLAPVLISWAGKGGVGKTSTSITIAQGAGRAGLKTTLIDSSIGQNGVSVVLRVNKRSTPTIYDAATSGDLKRAFLTPAMLSDIRTGGAVEDMTFALVAAPPSGLADPHVVTGDVYSRIIQLARETSDLVVIDTQIREAALAAQHTIFTQAIVPLLKADGWGVGLTDNSVEGFNHLLGRFAEFQAMGIGRERMLSVINRFDPNQVDPAQMKKQFRAYSEYLGIIEEDPHALAAFNSGRTALHLPGFHLMVNAILSRVIGDEQRFPYTNDIDSLMDGRAGGYDAAPRKKRRGLFALFGRK